MRTLTHYTTIIPLQCIQLITSQKQPIAPRDIINNAPAVNRRHVFGVYFITSLTSENLPVYNLDK